MTRACKNHQSSGVKCLAETLARLNGIEDEGKIANTLRAITDSVPSRCTMLV
jgi:hypothetical protein